MRPDDETRTWPSEVLRLCTAAAELVLATGLADGCFADVEEYEVPPQAASATAPSAATPMRCLMRIGGSPSGDGVLLGSLSNTPSRAERFAIRPGCRPKRDACHSGTRTPACASVRQRRRPRPCRDQPACTWPISTRTPDDSWMLSVFSIVTVIVGNSLGETPDQSVTRASLELNVPIGTSVPAAFFNHAW